MKIDAEPCSPAPLDRALREPGKPLIAPLRGCALATRRSAVAPSAYDCVRLVMIRGGGSAFLTGDCPKRAASVGDAVLVAPNALFGYEPEGSVTITILTVDTDYLIEHLFWQHLGLIPDRDAARTLAAKLYPDAVQVLRLGEREVERLEPILDELVIRTEASQGAAGYFHTHALLFMVLEAITPHVRQASVAMPALTSHQRGKRVAPPRWRAHRPIRREAALAAVLMQSDIAKRWPLAELAKNACLSPHQFANVFTSSFGVTPHTYLSILRVQRMAELVRETDQPITLLYRQVGWSSRGHAAIIFRRYLGVNPSEYRRYGPPTASQDGPGIGVARAAKSANESAKQPVGRGVTVELSTGQQPGAFVRWRTLVREDSAW